MSALAPADLARFFRSLAPRLPCRVKIVLTGGGEAMVLGGNRPTHDLDFGVIVPARFSARWSEIERAIADASRETGIPVQYSEDIDRWSSVALPARRFRTRFHRRIGRLVVHLLDPTCWAVYKLARYLESDVEDLVSVLGHQSISSTALARLCGQSLRASPRSPVLFSFRRQVEHFFREHGSSVWGDAFRPDRAIEVFHRAASIASPRNA